MKNNIIITAYNNPALLYLYLEQIYQCETVKNYRIGVFTEEGFDEDEKTVVDIYKKEYPLVDIELIVRKCHPTCQLVGFHNILTAYTEAAKWGGDYLIVGEEDLYPFKDYLRFNHYCYEYFLKKYERIFCVAHKRRPEAELDGDPEILIGDYQSTSPSVVSIRAVKEYLEPFFEMDGYFHDPITFNFTHFNKSRISPFRTCHHDGALERIMEHYKLFALKPDAARTAHLGLQGVYSRGQAPQGTLEQKIAEWRHLIANPDELKARSELKDNHIVVAKDQNPKWEKLELDINRDRARASSWWYDKDNEFKQYIKSL